VVIPSGAARQVHLDLDVLAQNPGLQPVTVSVTSPWRSRVQPVLLVWSGRLPVQQSVPITVDVPAGAAVGTYPVQVKVSGPNTVTRSATIEVRTPSACVTPGPQCAVDLTRDRNHDGTATVSASDQGNFDGGGWSYDASLLPAAGPVSWDGVTYAAPDPLGTASNFVEARGQSLLLPAGQHTAVKLVGASHNGPVSTTVTAHYTDGTSADLALTFGDWAGSGSPVVLEMPHRIKAGSGVDGPPVRLFGLSAGLDGGKTVQSVSLPNDPRVEVYALTLV
jgi:hypothetical protein